MEEAEEGVLLFIAHRYGNGHPLVRHECGRRIRSGRCCGVSAFLIRRLAELGAGHGGSSAKAAPEVEVPSRHL